MNATSYRRATLHTPNDPHAKRYEVAIRSGACGAGFRASLCSPVTSEPGTCSCLPVFVKSTVAWPTHALGEMHVREIIASALDRVLGTGLVPRITGLRIRPADLPKDMSSALEAATTCARSAPGALDARQHPVCKDCFGAAAVSWIPTAREARLVRAQVSSNWHVFAAFNYLAGCARSHSALFLWPGAGVGDGLIERARPTYADNLRFMLAMDNDRCFLPVSADWTGVGTNLLSAAWFAEQMQPISKLASEPGGVALLASFACLGPGKLITALEQLIAADTLAPDLSAYLHAVQAQNASTTIIHQLHERLHHFARLAQAEPQLANADCSQSRFASFR